MNVKAQDISSVQARQQGEKIVITYDISDSRQGEKYYVNIWCRTNTGEYQVKSAEGDIGRNVPGGKSQYNVEWDALKDVDELSSASFVIRAEKTASAPAKPELGHTAVAEKKKFEKPLNGILQYYGGFQDTPIGARFNLVKKIGFYMAGRYGDGTYTDDFGRFEVTFTSFTAGFSTQFSKSYRFAVFPYVGGGYGIWSLYDHNVFGVSHDFGPQIEYGLSFSIKRVVATFGGTHLIGNELQTNFLIGLGYVVFQR
ncbi:MAG: hypothetical protein GVY19_04535 [Bacteroidetes bacterium]|nr:hypothetical protein [Bacteroidota bacterium]